MKRGIVITAGLTCLFCALFIWNCKKEASPTMNITKQSFGRSGDGAAVDLYSLSNENGMIVRITNYGGIITSVIVPDANGKFGDIVLGYDRLDGYLDKTPYFGAIVGRYGNRIAGGRFEIDGRTYTLATNNGPNHLHGGTVGFDKVLWEASEIKADGSVGLELNYTSADMEEGYPGNLEARVVYTLSGETELKMEYRARADKATHVNLTNHSYFNLRDGGASPHLDHLVMINADRFTPVDETLIPTGELRSVEDTPFDFRTPRAIGDRIDADDEQIARGGGYDHNYVLNGEAGELRLAARVVEKTTGRVMEVFTEEPGMQFYTGNFLDGTIIGKGGVVYKFRHGFCLETQHFPNSPNQPDFPSTLLRPGEEYKTVTVYKFSVVD